MNYFLMTISMLFLALAVHSAHAAGPALTADEIIKKATQNVYAPSEQSVYVMKLTDKDGGEKLRRMKVWFKREGDDAAKLMIKFAEPADIRGTALLSLVAKGKSAEQWMYLPGVKKVRRIKGGNDDEAFLGSDFTVGDLSADNQDHFKYELSGSRKCGDAECYVLTGLPRTAEGALGQLYSKKELEVRKDNFMTPSVKFFNREGTLEKVMALKDFKKTADGRWMADKTEMRNLLTSHATVIEVEKRDTTKSPADSMFTQAALDRNL